MKFKPIFTMLSILSISLFYTSAQPVGSPANSPFWNRGGNLQQNNSSNIFGTFWNSGIYTYTASVCRTRLNGNQTANINGVNQNVTGYFGIGLNNYFATQTPMAMLHLEGPNNSNNYGGAGWRAWMRTGMFAKENSDAMYVGLQTQTGTTNRSDAIINPDYYVYQIFKNTICALIIEG